MNVRSIETWHKTRSGYLVFALVELGLVYAVTVLALESGSLWEYGLAIIFLFGFLRNTYLAVRMHKK